MYGIFFKTKKTAHMKKNDLCDCQRKLSTFAWWSFNSSVWIHCIHQNDMSQT